MPVLLVLDDTQLVFVRHTGVGEVCVASVAELSVKIFFVYGHVSKKEVTRGESFFIV